MAETTLTLELAFEASIGLVSLAAALVVWFAPKPDVSRRLLAALLFLLAAQQAAQVLQALGADRLVTNHYWMDLRHAAHIVTFSLLWFYPSRASLRSGHGVVLAIGGAILALHLSVFLFAKPLMFVDPSGAWDGRANWTRLGAYLSLAMAIALYAMAVSAFLRAAGLAGPKRREAFILLSAVFVGWLSRTGMMIGWAIEETARGGSGREILAATLAVDLSDTFTLAMRMLWPIGTLVAVFALLRIRTWIPAAFAGWGLFRVLLENLPGAAMSLYNLYVIFPGIFAVHVISRYGALGIPRLGLKTTLALVSAGFFCGFLAALSAGLGIFGDGAFALATVTVGAVLVGLAVAVVMNPGFVPAFRTQPDMPDRLGPYREALRAVIETGADPAETRRSLLGLRRELGLTDTEHALMDYTIRATGPARFAAGDLSIGMLFAGRYRVKHPLGPAGAGPAYMCRDERADRPVVVKLLVSMNGDGTERALREARAAAAVRHPRVVTLYDVEAVGDQGFLVMEYMAGGSLAERVAHGRLHRDEFARVSQDVLEGLAAVHEAGLVHRDIKPSNILLDAEGNAKVTDFGIARELSLGATLTGNGSDVAGTVCYMAPEQAKGRRVTPRSDLYSAAATLYEAYTGEPWLKPRPNESAVEVRIRAAKGRSFPTGWRGPRGLAEWFAKALDREPAARFSDARAMLVALNQHAPDARRAIPDGKPAGTGRRQSHPPVRARARRRTQEAPN